MYQPQLPFPNPQQPQPQPQAWPMQPPQAWPQQAVPFPAPVNGHQAPPSLFDQLRQRGLDPSAFKDENEAIDTLIKAAELAQQQQEQLAAFQKQQAVQQQLPPGPGPAQTPEINLADWRPFLEVGEDGRVRPTAEAGARVPWQVVQMAQKDRDDRRQHLELLTSDPRKAIEQFGGDYIQQKIQEGINAELARRDHEQTIEKFIDDNRGWIYTPDGKTLTTAGSMLMEKARQAMEDGVPENKVFAYAQASLTQDMTQKVFEIEQQMRSQPQQATSPFAPQQPYPGMPANQNAHSPQQPQFQQAAYQQPQQPQWNPPSVSQPFQSWNQPRNEGFQNPNAEAPKPPQNGSFFERRGNGDIPPGAMRSEQRNVPDQGSTSDESFDVEQMLASSAREQGLLPPEPSDFN